MDEPAWRDPVELDEDLVAQVKPELYPGERLLWVGKPVRCPPFSMENLALGGGCLGIAYSLTALSLAAFFGIFGEAVATFAMLPVLGTICALFAVVATIAWTLGGIASHFERRKVTRESYALTDRRALIWTPGETRKSVNFFSHDVGHFDRVHRVERPDGSGVLNFSNSRGRRNPGPNAFREVADVKRVEALARQYLIQETPDVAVEAASDETTN
jgi:hypothetical protein